MAASGTVRSYEIATLREVRGDRALSAFHLDEPAALRGTAFLVEESLPATAAGLRVWLYLPSGKHQTFEVRGATLSQPLLGSDFSYQDWRLWLPVADLDPVRRPDRVAGERTLLAVEARPRTVAAEEALGWARVRLTVDPENWTVVRADFFAPGEQRPGRRYRASGQTEIDGAWIPRRMVMERIETGERTVVELIEAWHDRDVPAAALRPEGLPDLGRWLPAAAGSGLTAQPAERRPAVEAGSRPGR